MELLKRYGFWAGIILVFAGLIAHWIIGVWSTVPLILLILGGVLAVVGLITDWAHVRTFFGKQTTRYGMSSLAGTLIVLIILVFANLILHKFDWRVDTTAGGQYSLADQTVKVLKNLKKVVKVTVFDVEQHRDVMSDHMKEYQHYSSKFEWNYVDPDKQPQVAKQNNIKKLGTIVVESGGKTERVEDYSEQNLTNAMIKVTRNETKTVYFTTGHGEHGLDDESSSGYKKVADAIKEQNYVPKDLLLASADSIPGDASVVVVAGAQNSFFDKELNMLAQYIGKGGNVYFLLDPTPAQGFENFLKKYYFKVGDNIIVDASGLGRLFGTGPAVPLVNSYSDSPITKDFSLMTFYPLSRSVDIDIPPNAHNYTGKVIAHTGAHSWGETNLRQLNATGKVEQDPEDLSGPVPIAASMEVPKPGGSGKARLLVFGDSDFATNRYFDSQGNGNLFMNGVNWLLQDEDLISVRPKGPEDRRLQMTQSQVKLILILVIISLPIAILLIGGVVYWVRRR